MNAAQFLEAINNARPDLPPSDVLKLVEYQHNGLTGWGESDDLNAVFREAVTNLLFQEYQAGHKKILRVMLAAEIRFCGEETMMTDVLRKLTFMLYDLGDVTDIPLLFEAKMHTSFDAMCALDAELILGKDRRMVKQYYTEHPVEGYDILGYIVENEDWVASPEAFIKGMRKFYAR